MEVGDMMIRTPCMAPFLLQYFITIKYIVWQKTTGTKVVSMVTRVHKVVNKVTRVVRDKVLKAELNLLATREAKAPRADAVVKTWAIPPVAEVQVVIKTAAVANIKW